jgi:hypothetical protein
MFETFLYLCFKVQWPYSTGKLHIATITMYVSFLPHDCVHREVTGIADNKDYEASPKSANMKTQQNSNQHKSCQLGYKI